ncbi:TonB-dependent receptor plug domain-containing protein [Tellurirhabdus rosea]|uniref:TonB-dependent receptor plug domain-containing protein n=1 Tax=Tellurirhabdus rosea TaxID=2674997 RepID=UPI00224CCB2D|nr:TonB-dependent receptor plug domain-containing protein [Tellurirhabdus rosea]
MRYSLGFLATVLTGLNVPAWAQTREPAAIVLDTLAVRAERRAAFRIGQNEILLDSVLVQSRGQFLSDVLRRYTGIPNRAYGNGMLSALIIRGLPASRTAVLWHGFPINSSMLGSTDLNLIPISGLTDMAVQPGAGSSLFGSDAIAGSIALSARPEWKPGFKATAGATLGSFGLKTGQATAGYTNERQTVSLRTSVSLLDHANRFWFRNTSRFGQPRERQQDAGIRQKSVSQDVFIRFSKKIALTLSAWWNQSQRQLQAPISVRISDESQADETLSSLASVEFNHTGWKDKLSVYHQYSSIRYQKPSTQLNEFSSETRTIFRYEQDWRINRSESGFPNWQFQWGLEGAVQQARAESYQQTGRQNRFDVYVLATGHWTARLRSTVHLRQSTTTGFRAPFTPALGLEYDWRLLASLLTVKAHAARSYRVPTLNDRYWRPGGNLNLLPESGFSRELTVSQTFSHSTLKNWHLTAYRNTVQNWLDWVPGDTVSYWSVRNLPNVRAEGLEAGMQFAHKLGRLQLQSAAMLNYNRTVSLAAQGAGGRPPQLMYVPNYSGNWTIDLQYRSFVGGVQHTYTGRRFTTSDNSYALPGYWLADAYLRHQRKFARFQTEAIFRVNNVFNTTYQAIQDRAMPGRHYQFSLFFIYP